MKAEHVYKTLLGVIFLLLLMMIASCCSKPPSKGSIQSVQGIELLPLGASFSFLDSEGKLTTITKIDSVRVVVEHEQPKRQRAAPFIHIGSEGKDKSETNTADNGGSIINGNDKSDNKEATDSGNKEVSNSFPWYVWIILVLGLVFIVWWKIK